MGGAGGEIFCRGECPLSFIRGWGGGGGAVWKDSLLSAEVSVHCPL